MTEPESFPTTYLSEDETRRYLRLPPELSRRAFRERMRRAGIPPCRLGHTVSCQNVST